jgi:hypothetical protein
MTKTQRIYLASQGGKNLTPKSARAKQFTICQPINDGSLNKQKNTQVKKQVQSQICKGTV